MGPRRSCSRCPGAGLASRAAPWHPDSKKRPLGTQKYTPACWLTRSPHVSIHAPDGANLEEVTPLPNQFYLPEGGGFKPEFVFDGKPCRGFCVSAWQSLYCSRKSSMAFLPATSYFNQINNLRAPRKTRIFSNRPQALLIERCFAGRFSVGFRCLCLFLPVFASLHP